MLLSLLLLAGLLALTLIASLRPRAAPSRCPCGRPADVFDHDRPWVVACARCWLRANDG